MKQKSYLPTTATFVNDKEGVSMLHDSRVARLPSKCGTTVGKILPVMGIFTFLFGTTILGFSLHYVGDEQIGYYYTGEGYYKPGIYVHLPWAKDTFRIANIGNSSFTLTNQRGVTNDYQYYEIKHTRIDYNVSNLDAYVAKLKEVKGDQNFIRDLAMFVSHSIKDELEDVNSWSIENKTQLLSDTLVEESFGVRITAIRFSRVTFESVDEFLSNRKKNQSKPSTTTQPPHIVMSGGDSMRMIPPDFFDKIIRNKRDEHMTTETTEMTNSINDDDGHHRSITEEIDRIVTITGRGHHTSTTTEKPVESTISDTKDLEDIDCFNTTGDREPSSTITASSRASGTSTISSTTTTTTTPSTTTSTESTTPIDDVHIPKKRRRPHTRRR